MTLEVVYFPTVAYLLQFIFTPSNIIIIIVVVVAIIIIIIIFGRWLRYMAEVMSFGSSYDATAASGEEAVGTDGAFGNGEMEEDEDQAFVSEFDSLSGGGGDEEAFFSTTTAPAFLCSEEDVVGNGDLPSLLDDAGIPPPPSSTTLPSFDGSADPHAFVTTTHPSLALSPSSTTTPTTSPACTPHPKKHSFGLAENKNPTLGRAIQRMLLT